MLGAWCLPWSPLTHGLPNQPAATYLAQPRQQEDGDGPYLVRCVSRKRWVKKYFFVQGGCTGRARQVFLLMWCFVCYLPPVFRAHTALHRDSVQVVLHVYSRATRASSREASPSAMVLFRENLHVIEVPVLKFQDRTCDSLLQLIEANFGRDCGGC